MNYLLDTHILLWAAFEPERLKKPALAILEDRENRLQFSAASIWEVSIKSSLGRDDFTVDPRILRRSLIENGYDELTISSAHAAAVRDLAPLHRDPFDRMLVAQARAEGVVLLSSDRAVGQYGSPVQLV